MLLLCQCFYCMWAFELPCLGSNKDYCVLLYCILLTPCRRRTQLPKVHIYHFHYLGSQYLCVHTLVADRIGTCKSTAKHARGLIASCYEFLWRVRKPCSYILLPVNTMQNFFATNLQQLLHQLTCTELLRNIHHCEKSPMTSQFVPHSQEVWTRLNKVYLW